MFNNFLHSPTKCCCSNYIPYIHSNCTTPILIIFFIFVFKLKFYPYNVHVFFPFIRLFLIPFQHASHKCITIFCIPLQNVDGQITFHITILLVLQQCFFFFSFSYLQQNFTHKMLMLFFHFYVHFLLHFEMHDINV